MAENKAAVADFSVKELTDRWTGRKMIKARHKSGLQVDILNYARFEHVFVACLVPFGSIHTTFSADQTYNLPAGSAHYLEHCVFSRDEEGGLMGKLSDLGATANAYTANDHTLYYFSAPKQKDNLEKALRLWLKALWDLKIDEPRVEAERSIILAEIDQYKDDPQSLCQQQLLDNLYQMHPVRQDIAGDFKSVSQISASDLNLAWQTFYSPRQMKITLAGDLVTPEVLDVISDCLAEQPDIFAKSLFSTDLAPAQKGIEIREMDVATPMFLLGLKETTLAADEAERAVRGRMAALMINSVLSPVSPVYDSLYRDGLINSSFGSYYAEGPGYAFLLSGGESEKPEAAAQALKEQLLGLDPAKFTGHVFASQKKAAVGRIVATLNSVTAGDMFQARAGRFGLDLFDYPAIYDKINATDALNMLQNRTNPDFYSISIIQPRR